MCVRRGRTVWVWLLASSLSVIRLVSGDLACISSQLYLHLLGGQRGTWTRTRIIVHQCHQSCSSSILRLRSLNWHSADNADPVHCSLCYKHCKNWFVRRMVFSAITVTDSLQWLFVLVPFSMLNIYSCTVANILLLCLYKMLKLSTQYLISLGARPSSVHSTR